MQNMKRHIAIRILFWLLITANAFAQVVEIPDTNLSKAIREELQIPVGSPVTQQQMEKLQTLDAYDMGIADLTGLKYANNLKHLSLWGNPISNLTPLSNLTQLRGLDVGGCQISDLTPLQNLTQLTHLQLSGNQIIDISTLSNLTQLQELKVLDNPILDYSPVEHLSIPSLIRDEICDLPSLSIHERLQNRTFPAVFAAWGNSHYSQVNNLKDLSHTERLALHDLNWDNPYFNLDLLETHQGWWLKGRFGQAQQIRDQLVALNPNMLFLVELRVRDAWIGYYPQDFPYWLKDANGNIVKDSYDSAFLLIDFTLPGMQDLIVQQAIAAANCGLFDGIFLDWLVEDSPVLILDDSNNSHGYVGNEVEQNAKDTIIQRIRASVPDEFLIIANYNREKMRRRAWGINGSFLETRRDNDRGYTREGIEYIENTLLWLERNAREPRINCLEGWGIPSEPPNSIDNLRWMRLFTTMSLTHSDGYVLYGMENSHQHIWHDFWNADLGHPVGPKAQRYENIEGLFIREFTNGWAVYNRSGKTQAITLPRVSTGVSSNKQDITHLLPDLDGEIYLRKGKPYDLNRDGTVNVLDLIIVSQGFNTTQGDINGDGTTDILDLTLVAQQLTH